MLSLLSRTYIQSLSFIFVSLLFLSYLARINHSITFAGFNPTHTTVISFKQKDSKGKKNSENHLQTTINSKPTQTACKL